jgi:non-homologous end joining protein Ku
MPSRALWKGAISFGLVTVPVSLHAATESKEELSLPHQARRRSH